MGKFYVEGTYKARGRMIGEAYREEIRDLLEIMRIQEFLLCFTMRATKKQLENLTEIRSL